MTRTEMIQQIAQKTGLTQKDVKAVAAAAEELITETVAAGDKISMVGFGTFYNKHRDARTGRNPLTGEAMEFAASDTLAFKPSKKAK